MVMMAVERSNGKAAAAALMVMVVEENAPKAEGIRHSILVPEVEMAEVVAVVKKAAVMAEVGSEEKPGLEGAVRTPVGVWGVAARKPAEAAGRTPETGGVDHHTITEPESLPH